MKSFPAKLRISIIGLGAVLSACGAVGGVDGDESSTSRAPASDDYAPLAAQCGSRYGGNASAIYDLVTSQATCGSHNANCTAFACTTFVPALFYSLCCYSEDCVRGGNPAACQDALNKAKNDLIRLMNKPTDEFARLCTDACKISAEPFLCCLNNYRRSYSGYKKGDGQVCSYADVGRECPYYNWYRPYDSSGATAMNDGFMQCKSKPFCVFRRVFTQTCTRDTLPYDLEWKDGRLNTYYHYHCKGSSAKHYGNYFEVYNANEPTLYQDSGGWTNESICANFCAGLPVPPADSASPSTTTTTPGTGPTQPTTSPPSTICGKSQTLYYNPNENLAIDERCGNWSNKYNKENCDPCSCNGRSVAAGETCTAAIYNSGAGTGGAANSGCPSGATGTTADWSPCSDHTSCRSGVCGCSNPNTGTQYANKCLPNIQYYNGWCSASC